MIYQGNREFKRAVKLMMNRGTRTVEELAKRQGVSPSLLHRWYLEYGDAVASRAHEPAQAREDIEALRRRVRQLEQENALLKSLRREGEPVRAFRFSHAQKADFRWRLLAGYSAYPGAGYYQRLKESPSNRCRSDQQLAASWQPGFGTFTPNTRIDTAASHPSRAARSW